MALLLATIAAMYLLGTRHGYTNAQLEKIMTKSLEPTGMILLVTACGGVLRYMLQNSGLGDVIGNAWQTPACRWCWWPSSWLLWCVSRWVPLPWL